MRVFSVAGNVCRYEKKDRVRVGSPAAILISVKLCQSSRGIWRGRVTMENLALLAFVRMDKAGQHLQKVLATMRQTCLWIDRSGVQPHRNPSLDELVEKIELARASIMVDLLYLESECRLGADHEKAIADTHRILGDANELIELIVWLGGKRHIEGSVQYQLFDMDRGR